MGNTQLVKEEPEMPSIYTGIRVSQNRTHST
jgi:hypothetical protein